MSAGQAILAGGAPHLNAMRLRRRALLEPLLVFLAAGTFYVALYGELPYHDVQRFVSQIESGRYVWDMGHVWLQPVTLLWHKYLGFEETAEASQKHINSFFAASAIGVFYFMLLRLGIPAWQRIVASALVMASCNVLILAPTAHMKLVAFPFLTAAFYFAVIWERSPTRSNRDLVQAAVWLALAAAFHSSILAVPPFLALAILLTSIRTGGGWYAGLRRAALFGAICGAVFLIELEIARLVFFGQFLGVHDFMATVGEKNGLRTGYFSLTDTIARLIFGTVNNMIAAPDLGPVLRAWLSGQVPSLAPYARTLAGQTMMWLATLVLIVAIYLRSLRCALSGSPVLVPLAFLVAALAWNTFFNINEPEHWFHLTVPTVFLFLVAFPGEWVRPILPIWATITIGMNLALWALPEARYPLRKYEAEMRREFSSRDLLVGFIEYGGGANITFYDLPSVPRVYLDQLYSNSTDEQDFYTAVDRDIQGALDRGGRVVAFSIFDPYNWNAPWMMLAGQGMPKKKLVGFFDRHYRIVPLGEIAEIPAWQLLPTSASKER